MGGQPQKFEKGGGRRGLAAMALGCRVALAGVVVASLPGCSARQPLRDEVSVGLLAVLPIERVEREPEIWAAQGGRSRPPLPPDAGAAITAQLYRVLAERTDFRFVPDLTTADALGLPGVRTAPELVGRALALGKAVGADGVIFGRVFRFQERVGTEFGASEAAGVSFELALAAVKTGELIWRGQFDETQEPLSANLLNWWMFWRAGPRWLTARELAGLGVERLFGKMARVARP